MSYFRRFSSPTPIESPQPGTRVEVAPKGWRAKPRLIGYVTGYREEGRKKLVTVASFGWHDGGRKLGPGKEFPTRYVTECLADTDPPPTPPKIRLSIHKDGDAWILTTLNGQCQTDYPFQLAEHYGDVPHLDAVLDEVFSASYCVTCGAPLWDVNGRVVCSRHWQHYPQPESVTEQCTVRKTARGYSGALYRHTELTTTLPGIQTINIPPPKTNHSKLMAWAKRNLVAEQREETTADGSKITFTTYRGLTVVHSVVKPTVPVIAPASAAPICISGGKRRDSDPLAGRYETYCADMKAHGIEPRAYALWVEHIKRAQQRTKVMA